MSKPRNTTGKGYFTVKGPEPLAERAIAVRLPKSLDSELRDHIGTGGDLSDWLRKAIAARLEQEKQARESQGECA